MNDTALNRGASLPGLPGLLFQSFVFYPLCRRVSFGETLSFTYPKPPLAGRVRLGRVSCLLMAINTEIKRWSLTSGWGGRYILLGWRIAPLIWMFGSCLRPA